MISIFNAIFDKSPHELSSGSSSNSSSSSSLSPPNLILDTENKKKKKSTKKVRFYGKIKVILVPSIAEYKAAGCDLWFDDSDFVAMREDFRLELHTAMLTDSSLGNDVYAAMRKLYQPAPALTHTDSFSYAHAHPHAHIHVKSSEEEKEDEKLAVASVLDNNCKNSNDGTCEDILPTSQRASEAEEGGGATAGSALRLCELESCLLEEVPEVHSPAPSHSSSPIHGSKGNSRHHSSSSSNSSGNNSRIMVPFLFSPSPMMRKSMRTL